MDGRIRVPDIRLFKVKTTLQYQFFPRSISTTSDIDAILQCFENTFDKINSNKNPYFYNSLNFNKLLMTRILSLFVMFMLFGVLAFAQSRVVTGKIVDDKGNGVPAASIRVNNSNSGTSTENDGTFSIRVDNAAVLSPHFREIETDRKIKGPVLDSVFEEEEKKKQEEE